MTATTSEEQRQSADWDIRSGASNYLTLIIAQAVGSLGAFATVWLATRLMGAEGYGRVAAVIAATQLVMQIALNWTAHSVTRFGCEEFVKTQKISKSFWTRLLILIPNLLLILFTSPFWLPYLASWLKISSEAQPLVLLYLLASVFWLHLQHTLQGVKLQRLQSILMATERILTILVLLFFVMIGKITPFTLIMSYLISAVTVSLTALWYLRLLIFPFSGLDKTLIKGMLKFSLPLLPSGLAGYLMGNYLDALFITHYLSIADLGRYSVAYLIVGTFLQLPTLGSFLLLPLFISLQNDGRKNGIERYLKEVCPLMVLGWSLGCILSAAICSHLLPLVFGPSYQDVSRLMWPMMATAAMTGPVLLGFGAVANAWLATYISFIATATQGVINVVLNIVLIPHFGLIGCAWASTIACCVCLIVWAYFISKRVPAAGFYSMIATLPVVIGAITSFWQQSQLVIAFIAIVTFALVFYWRQQSLLSGLQALRAANILTTPKILQRRWIALSGVSDK